MWRERVGVKEQIVGINEGPRTIRTLVGLEYARYSLQNQVTGGLWHSSQPGDGLFTASPPEGNAPEKSRVSQALLRDERAVCHLYLHLSFILVRFILTLWMLCNGEDQRTLLR